MEPCSKESDSDCEIIEDIRLLFEEKSTNSQEELKNGLKMENQEVPHDDENSNYGTLLSIFPNIDPAYIEKICVEPPFKKVEGVSEIQMLINHLLGYNGDIQIRSLDIDTVMFEIEEMEIFEEQKRNENFINDQLFKEFIKNDQEIINENLNILENIFPDACPVELRKIVEQNDHKNIEALTEIVETFLSNRNYEKRNQNYAKIKFREQIKEYTDFFCIDKFIKEFQKPFNYFENPGRKETFQTGALNYLKKKYINHPAECIESVYASTNYNLSIADKELQKIFGDCHIDILQNAEIFENNITLLKEVAFIQNKTFISSYLNEKNKKDEKEMQFFKTQKLLLTCQCCYDDELKPTECIECDGGSHIFCAECVVRGATTVVSNGEIEVLCFAGCKKEIPFSVLRNILPVHLVEALTNKRQELEVHQAKLDGLVTCPCCTFQMELGPEITVFTCKNPECMKITCRLCKKTNHLPLKCAEVPDAEKARIYIEEELSKVIIRKCHRCFKPFIKDYGCNKMRCSCGATMCYICKKPDIDYCHFEGENKCMTHQNSKIYDAEQLELKRREAIMKLNKDNPDLQLPKV